MALAPILCSGSDMITLIQERLAWIMAPHTTLRLLDLPMQLRPLHQLMLWTTRSEDDPGHRLAVPPTHHPGTRAHRACTASDRGRSHASQRRARNFVRRGPGERSHDLSGNRAAARSSARSDGERARHLRSCRCGTITLANRRRGSVESHQTLPPARTRAKAVMVAHTLLVSRKTGKSHATFRRAIGLLHPAGSSSPGRAPLSFNDEHFCRREQRPSKRGYEGRCYHAIPTGAATLARGRYFGAQGVNGHAEFGGTCACRTSQPPGLGSSR
jgi:hypothetical protein